MIGKGLFDDQGHLLGSLVPLYGGMNLGSPATPFAKAYITSLVTTGSEQFDTVVIPSTGGGFTAFNTADETTNFEDFKMDWNTNVFQAGNRNGGSGTLRNLEIGVFGSVHRSTLLFDDVTVNGPKLSLGDGTSSGVVLSAASGTSTVFKINPYVNQSGTAAYTGLLVNAVENATGSGAHKLLDLQLGGTSKFNVLSSGATTIVAGGLTITAGGATITAGGLTITAGGATITAGGLVVTAGGASVVAGGLIIGTGTIGASAALEIVSTTQGLLLPRMTTTQRDAISSPAEGLVVYNTTTHKINVRVAAAWEAVTSA